MIKSGSSEVKNEPIRAAITPPNRVSVARTPAPRRIGNLVSRVRVLSRPPEEENKTGLIKKWKARPN